jgi:hypothetical protein
MLARAQTWATAVLSAGRQAGPGVRPQARRHPRGCIIPARSMGTNAPFDPLCGATWYAGGTARARWASPSAEGRVEQGPPQPCPSDALGTWSRHGNPGDSRCLPSGSPLQFWPRWWPRPPWDPTSPHHRRWVGRPGCAVDAPYRAGADGRADHHHAPAPAEHLTRPVDHQAGHRAARRQQADHHDPTHHDPGVGHGWPHDDQQGPDDGWCHDHPPTVTAPTTTAESTTTLLTTTSVEPTTTTTEPPSTTEPATTTTGQSVLRGDQAASVSAATAAVLLPILGLLYLLRGLVPQPGGRHARRRGAKHLRRRG